MYTNIQTDIIALSMFFCSCH